MLPAIHRHLMDAMGIYGNQEKFDKFLFIKCLKHPDICRYFQLTVVKSLNVGIIAR